MPLMQCVCGNNWIMPFRQTHYAPSSLDCIECGGNWKPNYEYNKRGESWKDENYVQYHLDQYSKKKAASHDCMQTLDGHYSKYLPMYKHSPTNLMRKYKEIKQRIPYDKISTPEFNMCIRKIKMLLNVNDLETLNGDGCPKYISKVYKKSVRTKYSSNPRYMRAEDRHNVFVRDNYSCKECGRNNKQTTLHIDHIIPVSKGGRGNIDNLQTLCFDCNMAKHARIW